MEFQRSKELRRIIKIKINKFKTLESCDQSVNLLLLKTSMIELIIVLNYYLHFLGKILNIDIKDSDSLKMKINKFTFYDETFFNEQERHFLRNMERMRNKLLHSDTIFPKLREVEDSNNELEKFLNKLDSKLGLYMNSKIQLERTIEKIESYLKMSTLFLTEDKKEVFDEYKEHINLAKKMTQKTSKDLTQRLLNLNRIHVNIKHFCPLTTTFLRIIENYNSNLLNNPLLLFKRYFQEFQICPGCSSPDYTREFGICERIIAGSTLKIKDFSPLKVDKLEFNAISSITECDNSWNGPCLECKEFISAPLTITPPDSIYCEDCGFFFIVNKCAGFSKFYSI